MDDSTIVEQRTKKIINFFKQNSFWVVGILLALIVYISIYVRTRGLPYLRDITTGGWTLGPDLDPFLFLRWAKYISANGHLFTNDVLRYVPIGFDTSNELLALPYSIAWFHSVARWFGSTSVEQSAALFPVFIFALTVIALFALARKMFLNVTTQKIANYSALIAAFFVSVGVSLLPRTIAGIPEKENGGFLFLCLTLALFLYAWDAKKIWVAVLFAFLAGASGAVMANFWGAYIYLYVIVGLSVLIAFVFGQVNRTRFLMYAVWLLTETILTIAPTLRYSLKDILTSPVTGIAFFTLGVVCVHWLLFSTEYGRKLTSRFHKLPSAWISILVSIIFVILVASLVYGIGFIPSRIANLFHDLVQPIGDRLGVTVAENRQPYFTEWSGNFGPVVGSFPLYFWLFMIGSIYIVNALFKHFHKKERWMAVGSYAFFLLAIVFSRYAESSVLNGRNLVSLFVYFGGVIVLLGMIGTIYYRRDKNHTLEIFSRVDMGLILLMVFFIISILSARGAVRLVMVLVPPTSIIVGYFFVSILSSYKKREGDEVAGAATLFVIGVVSLAILYTGYQMFTASSIMSAGYVPNTYTQQWQKSMDWVRTSTPSNAVFAHWWDYGYWVQTMGQRATMLDGGNLLPYWNYLMGRYGLTGNSSLEAAQLFYSHNVTHFLIDSSDIGKYTAFSSIGSDDNYDRRSWIGSFVRDSTRSEETKNSTSNLYVGGMTLDEDIIYEFNGTKVFLAGLNAGSIDTSSGLAGIGGLLTEIDKSTGNLVQVRGIYSDGKQQYALPLRYAFYNNTLIDFGFGVDAGVFFMPSIDVVQNRAQVDPTGAALYLSRRVVHSQLARLYLYQEEDNYFKVAHIQDDVIVESLKAQGLSIGHLVYYQGIRGPITIWTMNYPDSMTVKQEYLSTNFPQGKKFSI
jgi:asparagine N-glycosylation enzyme membrane subunit Stt3